MYAESNHEDSARKLFVFFDLVTARLKSSNKTLDSTDSNTLEPDPSNPPQPLAVKLRIVCNTVFPSCKLEVYSDRSRMMMSWPQRTANATLPLLLQHYRSRAILRAFWNFSLAYESELL